LAVIVGQQLKALISHEYDPDAGNRAERSDRITAAAPVLTKFHPLEI